MNFPVTGHKKGENLKIATRAPRNSIVMAILIKKKKIFDSIMTSLGDMVKKSNRGRHNGVKKVG